MTAGKEKRNFSKTRSSINNFVWESSPIRILTSKKRGERQVEALSKKII